MRRLIDADKLIHALANDFCEGKKNYYRRNQMSKSVLVIDTPENCLDCQFCYELNEGVEACCSISDGDKDTRFMKKIDCEYGYCQGKPDWCPLKPVPEKKNFWSEEHGGKFSEGWNACIDEILEGCKDENG